MSGPSKLSLAIALALIGGNAFALGLGSIQVKSGLNQPLNAEIAVTAESPAEAAGLIVGLASAEDLNAKSSNKCSIQEQRAFLNRNHLANLLCTNGHITINPPFLSVANGCRK